MGAALRAWCLVELRGSFLWDPLLLDHEYYWSWARAIAHGQLIGDDTFEMDPGYAYWLGLWLAVFGESLWVPRILGALHGLGAVALSGVLAWQVTSRRGAAHLEPAFTDEQRLRAVRWTSLVAGMFPIALFYDLLVMKTSLAPLALAAATVSVMAARHDERWKTAALAGAVFAAAATVRGNLLVLLPLCAVGAAGFGVPSTWRALVRRPAVRKRALAFVLAAGAVLAVPTAHNLAAAGTFAILHTGAGEVFFIGTHGEGSGEYVKLPFVRPHPRTEHQDFRDEAERRLGRPLSRGESSRYWWGQGLQRIVDAPFDYLVLEVKKGLMLLSAFEHPDSASFYFYSSLLTPLAVVGFFHFGLLFPLALAGMVLLRRRAQLFPALIAAGYVGAFLLFFVYARFRAPVAPLLVPFAVLGVMGAVSWRRTEPRRVLGYVALLAGLALVLNRTPPADPGRELGMQYANYGSWYEAVGQRSLAEALYARGAEVGNDDAARGLERLLGREGALP